jgi:hypothetical protein
VLLFVKEVFVLKSLILNKSKYMKRLLAFLSVVSILFGCQENVSVSDFTGNESTYSLVQGSNYPVNGSVTFLEKRDGSAIVRVTLTGTESSLEHPVHLHLGDITTPDAEVAALLNPVNGSTGTSETELKILADESIITYAQLIQLNACVKIHLSASGDGKTVILAAGNIGSAFSESQSNGRTGISICNSN